MNDETKLDGALCAGVGATDTAQAHLVTGAAPASGKKPYVPPRMQVIPLGPQRLLATSGVVSGPPVQVSIEMLAGVDYYFAFTSVDNGMVRKGRAYYGAEANCIWKEGWDFNCSALGPAFLDTYRAKAQVIRDYVAQTTDCSHITYAYEGLSSVRCGPDVLATPGIDPFVTFGGGVAWTAQEFFAGAQFDACSGNGSTFSGTYDGRRFEGTIVPASEVFVWDPDNYCPENSSWD